jgi:MFS family permease
VDDSSLEEPALETAEAISDDSAGDRPRRGPAPLVKVLNADDIESSGRRFRTFDSLIDVPAYRWYLLSMAGHWSALQMQQVARGYLAYQITGSFAALGLIEFTNTVPRMLLGMYGGVLADRVSRRVIIQIGQGANAVNVAVVAALLFTDNLQFYHLVIMTFMQGVINSFVLPARQAMVPEVVGRDRLMNALALNVGALNVMRLFAPAVAGGVIAAIMVRSDDDLFLAVGTVFALMSVLNILAVVGLFPVPRTDARTRAASRGETLTTQTAVTIRDRIGLPDATAAFAYLRSHPTIIWLIVIQTSTAMLALPYQRLLPGFVEEVLGAGEGRSAALIGLLLTMTAVGAILGSLLIASLPPRHRGVILGGSLGLFGVSLVGFSLSTVLWLSVGIVLVLGIGQAIRQSMVNILIQSRIEDAYRGRVSAVMLLDDGLESLGVFGVAMLADAFGPQVAIGLTGVTMLAYGGVVLAAKTFRNLD